MQDLKVIYEDNHIIVVEKESGILSQGDNSQDIDMLTIVKKYIKEKYDKKGNVFLGLVHRLDTVTSGIMIFAKTSKSASRLSEQIRDKKIKKTYLAVIEENMEKKEGKFQDYLIKDSKKNIVSITKDENKGKNSILMYKVLNTKNGKSLVEVELLTGRSHQIRVQFSSRGYHIYGDAKYGAENKDKKSIALHAYKLEINHPTKKEKMCFISIPKRYPFDEMIDEQILP